MRKSLIAVASIIAGCTVGCDASSIPVDRILSLLLGIADLLDNSLIDAVVAFV